MIYIASGFTGIAQPLTHPRIGYQRITGTITANGVAGFAPANAASVRTDSFWRPVASQAQWQIDAGAATSVSYCGIAAHDMATVGVTQVKVQSSTDGSTWVDRVTFTPVDNDAIMALFSSISNRYWRVLITYPGTSPTIGTIAFGPVMEWPRPCVFAPGVSFERATQTSYTANISDTGQWLGRTRTRQSGNPSMQVNHLSETWLASTFDPFAAYAETGPFFIADRPGSYPASVAYAWTNADLIPQRDTPNAGNSSSVTLDLTGFRA